MTTYTLQTSLTTSAQGKVTFPEGKTWEDVLDWYVKYDTLYVQFVVGEPYQSFELMSDSSDGTDWKHPLSVSVYPVDEDGDTDWDLEIAEAS